MVSRLLDSKGLFSACPPHLTRPTQLCSPDHSGPCPAPHFYEGFAGTFFGIFPMELME